MDHDRRATLHTLGALAGLALMGTASGKQAMHARPIPSSGEMLR